MSGKKKAPAAKKLPKEVWVYWKGYGNSEPFLMVCEEPKDALEGELGEPILIGRFTLAEVLKVQGVATIIRI